MAEKGGGERFLNFPCFDISLAKARYIIETLLKKYENFIRERVQSHEEGIFSLI